MQFKGICGHGAYNRTGSYGYQISFMNKPGFKGLFDAVMEQTVSVWLLLGVYGEDVPGQIQLPAYPFVYYGRYYGTAGAVSGY